MKLMGPNSMPNPHNIGNFITGKAVYQTGGGSGRRGQLGPRTLKMYKIVIHTIQCLADKCGPVDDLRSEMFQKAEPDLLIAVGRCQLQS